MLDALMRGDLPLARLSAQLLAIDAESQGLLTVGTVARAVLHRLGTPDCGTLPGLGAALDTLIGLLNPQD
ncbi:MAG: hypothetical protein WBW32_09440 [Luteibacter sp.]